MVRNPISVLWLGQNKMTMRKYIYQLKVGANTGLNSWGMAGEFLFTLHCVCFDNFTSNREFQLNHSKY